MMKTLKKVWTAPLLAVPLLFFVYSLSNAQDYHHSMYFNSPLSLNPAYAGKMPSDYRVTMIHREQWRMINAPFSTTSLGMDINFPDLFSQQVDNFGAGLMLINDELGNNIFRNNYVLGTVSGHKVLDARRRHRLSLGIQGGWVRKSLNTSGLKFANQYQGYAYNGDIPSNENLGGIPIDYFNLNAGLLWDFVLSKKINISAGAAFFNTLYPDEAVIYEELNNKKKNLKMRYVFNTSLTYALSESIGLKPLLLYVHQQKASEINAGMLLSYMFPGNNEIRNFTLYTGGMYRTKDAFIALAGIRYDRYEVAFSYDFTTSSLNDINNLPTLEDNQQIGAFEISLKYLGFLSRSIPNQVSIPCKIF